MEEIKCKQVGMLCGGKWDKMHDQNRRVYSTSGLSPTLHTMGGGNTEVKIIDDMYNNREPRVYDDCPSLRAERQGLKVVEAVAYDEQNGYLRQDGCVGTLTTDGSTPKHNNRVVEPVWDNDLGCLIDKNSGQCLIDDNDRPPIKRVSQYRIRKLTPRETFRLMGFDDTDFDNTAFGGVSTANYRRRLNARTMTKAEWKAYYRLTRTQTMSNSQLYKQAGNSIVTSVLMAIFGKLLDVDYESKIAELTGRLKDDVT